MRFIKTFNNFILENNLNEAVTSVSRNNIVIDCLEVLMQYQIFHWQVQGPGSFAKHKAFDEFTSEFKELTDSLVESMQGRYDIISVERQPVLANIGKLSPDEYTENILSKFEEYKSDFSEEGDLSNIIDEMIASITKLQYLLKLK